MQRLHRSLVLAVLVALTGLSARLAAAPAPASADAPLVPDKVRQLMQDRNYAEAVKAIDEAAQAKDAPHEYLAYLKGRALHLQDRFDDAAAVFESLEKQFPKGDWVRRARFARAAALARKGDFRSAELIYRAEAEYLLSSDRKQQIADLYLEFADAFFKPPKEEQKPDYQKALEFYQKALEVGPKADKKAEIELLLARCQQELKKLDEAIGLYEKFVKEHAASPLDIEARYQLGECQLAKGNFKEARRVWQDLLAKHRDSSHERIAEASFRLSLTWEIPVPAEAAQTANASAPPAPQATVSDENLSLGVAALEAFIEKFPTHPLASQAHLGIAQSYVAFGRYEDAVTSLKRLLDDPRYKDREQIADARNLLGRSYQLQKKFTEALATWRDYLAKHPAHKGWSAVQQEIVNTEYLMAREKFNAKDYEAARALWSEFLAKYPLDPRSAEILYQFGAMHFQKERWEAAIADWRRLVAKYPGNDWSSRAQFSIAAVLEEKLGKLEEALEEYRKVTWGSYAAPAQQAVARLTAKTLWIATERVFRSDETPKIKLVTRNLERVTVRAYKVDLETYFRKMHLARGVENLDITLIDSDKTFEFAIPNYVKHQEQQSEIEVPLPGDQRSGVMAVTVSSKTLEATTLVVQSDLDVIVKSSRNEVFVFAENMLTGKPWPAVRLLVSNGKQVFAEGTTGADGVFQKAYKELADAGDVRVFAVAEGHVASNAVSLQGVGVARGLSDKGYLYTDRPAYTAGQIVHVRGCIRHVEGALAAAPPPGPPPPADLPLPPPGEGPRVRAAPAPAAQADAYTIQQGKQFTLEILDGRNRLVHQQKVTLSAYGTFHAHFLLPPASPQGVYRVLVRDDARQNYQGTFLVHEQKIEPVHLVVDTPRKVYYRGEEIEGTIRAAFYYGAPLVGHEIRYQLADDRQHTATTDAKGEVRFKLPTREFRETQVLPLAVTLPDRNLQTAVNFFLASRGFSIDVATLRPVFVAGETFEATVTTKDAEGKPTSQKLVLRVLEKTTVAGKVGERLVEEHKLETDADGTARQTLKLDAGGRYALRAEGTDRFKNPVSGQALVQVSDEEDSVRLRILSEKHTYKVGDTAQVQLHWREEPALALVTFQGARVLDYKLVRLERGANKLAIPMGSLLAPNFELSVAVMTDPRQDAAGPAPAAATKPRPAVAPVNPTKPRPAVAPEGREEAKPADAMAKKDKPVRRFHTASSPFTVERDLRVAVAYQRKADAKGPIRPGEELEVTVTTTDPQGKPVAAEVSLAMIEQSLLDRFPWPVPPIEDFFRGQRREAAVRTVSSITFAYQATTRPINPQLLAEQDRLEIAREEAASLSAAMPALGRPTTRMLATPHVVSQEQDEERLGELGRTDADLAEVDDFGMGGMATGAGQPAPLEPASGRNALRGAFARQRRAGLGQEQGQQMDASQAGAAGVAGAIRDGTAMSRVQAERLERADMLVVHGSRRDVQQVMESIAQHEKFGAYRGAGQRFRYEPLTPEALMTEIMAFHDRRSVNVLDAKGQMQTLNLAAYGVTDAKAAEKLAADLANVGAVLLTGAGPHETGYWNPAIETGPSGTATLTFAVPERSTAWTLVSKGITTETLAGETTTSLVVKKELFAELKLPLAFTDGDEAEVQASVHNDAVEKGQITVVLKTTIGDRTVEDKKTIDVAAKGIHTVAFKTALRRPEAPKDPKQSAAPPEVNVLFELTLSAAAPGGAGGLADVTRAAVPLRPYGMPVFATASGSATSDATAWVESPPDMAMEGPSLQILVGPTVERSLMEIVLGEAPWCQIEAFHMASGLETATSDLMASLALQRLLGGTREAGGPQVQALDARVRSGISMLVASQNDDGGWSWTGRGGASDRYASARAVWALGLARAAGYTVPDDGFHKALGYVRNQAAAVANSDYDSKAILLHALSVAGQGDFALANRLYRDRPSLSPAALAYLALAFVEMDRKPTAGELLGLLPGVSPEGPAPRPNLAAPLPWCHSSVEIRALEALALQKVTPKAPKAKELVDWLLARRTGHRWTPDKATGPAALALCAWFAESRFQGEHYKLAVYVNDVQAKVLDIDSAAGTQVIDVPALLLKKGKQRINFQITGRGRYTYQCILGGFVPADQLKSTTTHWEVRRIYEPAPLELDGREIPRGFDVLEGGYTSFRNPLTQLPVGRRGVVNLEIWRRNLTPTSTEEPLEYLVVTEPIPSGATVIEKSVRGGFERFELSPGAITFYVGSRRHVETIHYELHGYLPGQYRAGPTLIRNAYRPEQLAVAGPQALAVLAQGAVSGDTYRPTPRELYELGKRLFDKGDLKGAQQHLTDLVDQWKQLRMDVYKDAVGKLLDVHLALGPPGKIVRYFEIIKEKWPAEEIPFAKIVKVGAAYHELGEYERSYLIFRATVESSFLRESGVAGFLESQGEFARSVEVMGRLLREYPPEAYVAAATYALAQRVYAKAPEAAADPKLREQKVNRVDLVRRAWTMLEGFLTAFPEDPAADQAAFSTANALLELKAFGQAAAACDRYAQRYPESDLLDSFWYMIGYCEFATGQHEKALAMCRRVAESKRIDKKTGAERESPNKHRAIYILGQVYHSLGKAAEAIAEYRRVEDRFADAKEAIEYFLRKAIELPEVTTAKPGEPAEIELKFRNVASCDLKVYRIDLMKFSLLKRNLAGITQINLAGIRPYHETTVTLGDGRDYRDRTQKLPLPLKDEGAYLVVCRGENLHASGLVLVTPLAVEVQEDAASGRVRTTVKDRPSGRYLSDVHVKVIGSRNTDFVSGSTDLRGVFVSDGIKGVSTVIAQLEPSRYAFFRGQTDLVPEAPRAAPPPPAPPAAKADMTGEPATLDQQLLQGLQEMNTRLQSEQTQQLKQIYQAPTKGVEAQKAY